MMLSAVLFCTTFVWQQAHSKLPPELPTHFSVLIEANFALGKDYTLLNEEFYDFDADAVYFRTRGPKILAVNHSLTLPEEDLSLRWSVDGESGETSDCRAALLSSKKLSRVTTSGNQHVRPSAELMQFGGPNRTEKYLGERTVRGIRCDAWSAETSNRFANYTLTYFFNQPNWGYAKNSESMEVVPVRAELTGSTADTPTRTAHEFHHVYEFLHFTSGPVPRHVFNPPRSESLLNYCNATEYCTARPTSRFCLGSNTVDAGASSSDRSKQVVTGVLAAIIGTLLGVGCTTLFFSRRRGFANLNDDGVQMTNI